MRAFLLIVEAIGSEAKGGIKTPVPGWPSEAGLVVDGGGGGVVSVAVDGSELIVRGIFAGCSIVGRNFVVGH